MTHNKDNSNIFKPLIRWAIWHIQPYTYTSIAILIVVGVMMMRSCVSV